MAVMARRYYKATRPDGTDFRTGSVLYQVGEITRHPTSEGWGDTRDDDPSSYLSVATVPTDCTGMFWPCRLFVVEGVGRGRTHKDFPNKRGFRAVRVVEELPATDALGPQGVELAALIEKCRTITYDQARGLAAAWLAAARDAARDAARALVSRDLITPEQFDLLYGPWRSVMEA